MAQPDDSGLTASERALAQVLSDAVYRAACEKLPEPDFAAFVAAVRTAQHIILARPGWRQYLPHA